MPRFKDIAVCIRHLDFSESSQVVVLLTEQHGKVRGLAKGSRRLAPSSMQRFSGGIEMLTVGQIVATTRRTSELAMLTEWDLQVDLHHLRKSLRAQRLGLYAADVTHAMLEDLDPHPVTFAALRHFLENLREESTMEAALLEFQWALLVDAGYRPVLDRDVVRDSALGKAEAYTFDPHAGGFTVDAGQGAWRVRHATLEALRKVQAGQGVPVASESEASVLGAIGKTNGDRALTLPALNEHDAGRANRLLCSYVRTILDRALPTMGVVLG